MDSELASPGVYEVATAHARRTLLPGRRLNIGRHPDNDLVIDDGSVSRFHARLDWSDPAPAPALLDLGSLNGTFVGGARVVRAPLGEWLAFRVGTVDVSASLQHPALIPSTGATLVRMFDEWAADERGTIEGPVDLQGVLLALEQARRTVTVDLEAPRFDAVVVFAGGRVVQARAAGLTGRDALAHLLGRTPRCRYLITAEVRPFDAGASLSVRDVIREVQAAPPARLVAS